MNGAILALVAPLLMKEFAIDLSTYRSGVQIALFVSIVGLYLWPWLADKFGRRNILALNIAVFSLAMPLVAVSPGWGSFVLIYSIVRFALNGEWAVGSMLVAETWPARLRGLVLSVDRSAWGIGAAPAGVLVTFVVTEWGWRAAYLLPVLVALLAVYVRLLCPESPYWVRTQDRKQRLRERQSAGFALDEDDRQWIAKTEQPSWRQLFLPDLRRSTVMATFVATMALVSYSGRHVDAVIPGATAWLVDRRIWELLYLVGTLLHGSAVGRRQPRIHFHVRRTYSGRPSSSMRFSEATAMATSVVCRPSVRERSASPITRL
jgi:MFS family permease